MSEPVPAFGTGDGPGAAVRLSNVVCRADASDADDSGTGRVSLIVPSGQSVALLSQPRSAATALFDAIAGLRRPRAGELWVDDIAVHRLAGGKASRYRACRGLVSSRFPLLSSLSVIDNVLAVPAAGRTDALTPGRAAQLLEFAGVRDLSAPVDQLPAEDQWRVMIARALAPAPRLLLAEDPAADVDSRAADRLLDVLMDAHAQYRFTLVLAAGRLASAIRCQRRVTLVDGVLAEDELTAGDDGWTRSRIDRIG